MSLSRLARPLGLALSGLLAVTTFALTTSPALAAITAPTGLAPTGAVSSSTPTFTWSRVSGASSYQLIVTQSSTSTTLIQQTTLNNRFVPTSNLPGGALSWQVRAVGASGNGPWASASTTINPTAPPSLTSPGNGAHLTQPAEPPLFKWSPVNGAVGYEIQVDNTGTWVSPTTYQAKGNTYFVDTPQAPGTWHWRVRANRGNGLFTQWSSASTYVIDQLADPQAASDMNTGTPQQDVRIHWQAVDGATAYQLQVGRDPDFNNIVDDVTTYGTVFSPDVTYDNDQYYWRVRAIDAGQNRMPWTVAQPFVFQRQWLDKPTLQYPADQLTPTVGDPMYYQWTPVKHATRYQVDASVDPNFSPATIHTCFTAATSLSPFDLSPTDNRTCGPQGQGVTTYWRVRAIDDPRGVVGIFSAIRKYVYDSGVVTMTSPADGATVDVPTLKWNPVRETQQYRVILRDKNGAVAADIQTHSTSWTPEGALLTTAGSPYTWTVQAVKGNGLISPLYPSHSFSVSGNMPTSVQPALTPLTGIVGDPATEDFPDLTWVPMPGATYYRLDIGVAGSLFFDGVDTSHINGTAYSYPAATDTDVHYLAPGQYRWQVRAYDANGQIGTSPVQGQFSITDLSDVTGQQIALDARAAVAGQACDNALSNVDTTSQICTHVPVTPVLTWNPVPHAAVYLVYLANDQELTNPVVNPYAVVTSNLWRPPSDLPDNTAQDSYYWYVRPCKGLGLVGCTADPASTDAAATNAFRKQSPAVQLQTPANTASVSTDPSFTWSDYLPTNQQVSYFGDADPSYQAARMYRIQISQTPTFNSLVDVREVDQPFYTPHDLTLPQGLLYWRVQATDAANNHLTWSTVRSFSNNQPAINLTGSQITQPAYNAVVGGATPFRWTPVDGASQYQIEVYRGDGGTHSPGNLILQATTKQPAFVWANYLPPSSATYTWRVRWLDGDGQPRPWSADSRFSVKPSGVTLTAPATNVFQPFNGVYLTWNAVPFAANYRVDFRDVNNNISSVGTAATAYAPSTVSDGVYDWRVAALDPDNNVIALSTWRTFTVDSQAPVLRTFSPQGTGTPKSKIKISFNEKVFGITTGSFTLKVKGRSTRLPAKLVLSTSGTGATLVPKSHLRRGKLYTVKVSKRIHDAAGNRFKTFSWKFTV